MKPTLTYLNQRLRHPLETYVIFAPMITFFLPLDQFFLWGGLACLFIVLNIPDFIRVIRFKWNGLLYLFCVYMTVLATLNDNTLGLIASFFLWLVTIYSTYLRTRLDKITFEILMVITGLGSMLSLTYTTVDFYTTSTYRLYRFFMQYIHFDYQFITGIAENFRVTSTFINPNFYGHISAFIALIAIFFCLDSIRNLKKNWIRYGFKLAFYTVVLAVNLVALQLTQSRSATFALLIGIPFLVAAFDGWLAITLGLGLFGVWMWKPELILSLLPRLESVGSSAEVRLDLFLIAYHEIQNNPLFGQGMYTMAKVIGTYPVKYQIHAHNLILEILLSSGLVGLGLLGTGFMNIIVKPLVEWIRGIKKQPYLPLLIGSLALFFANGYTDATFVFPQSFILIFLMAFSSELSYETL